MGFKKARTIGLTPSGNKSLKEEADSIWSSLLPRKKYLLDSPCCFEVGLKDTDLIVADSFSLKKLSLLDSSFTVLKVFEKAITSISRRKSSSLMAIGLENGDILIFDISSKTILRKLAGHKSRINNLVFFSSNTWLVSCSDDGSVRMWDFSVGEPLNSMKHSDYVRSIFLDEQQTRIFTSSYDGTISIWTYDNTADLTLIYQENLKTPIEAIYYSAEKLYVGGTDIRIYNVEDGKIHESGFIKCHHRAITQLYVDEKILISSSLDKSLKFHSLDSHLQHKLKFLSSVRCFLVSDTKVIVAKNNGEVILLAPSKRKQDSKVPVDEKFSNADNLIRSHKYRAAFDEALKSNNPNLFFSVYAQLIKLNALSSLSGRSEDEVRRIIRFIKPHSFKSQFVPYVRSILEEVIKNYPASPLITKELSNILMEYRRQEANCVFIRKLMPILDSR